MALRDYGVDRDKFEVTFDGTTKFKLDFVFPCSCCVHNETDECSEPCRTCDHNANAQDS